MRSHVCPNKEGDVSSSSWGVASGFNAAISKAWVRRTDSSARHDKGHPADVAKVP